MEAISIRGLTKQFSYYEKEAGWVPRFRNLLHREKLVREAVKDISFAIEAVKSSGFWAPTALVRPPHQDALRHSVSAAGGGFRAGVYSLGAP